MSEAVEEIVFDRFPLMGYINKAVAQYASRSTEG